MSRVLRISMLSLLGAVSAAQADVFRWVDEHGGVHYSDQWVPGSQTIKTTGSHAASSANVGRGAPKATPAYPVAAATTPDNSAQAAQAVKQDMAKVREQQCKDAKDRYDKAIQARRIYKPVEGDKSKSTDRPDDRQYLSDQEADAYRVKARQEMQDFCGSAASKVVN